MKKLEDLKVGDVIRFWCRSEGKRPYTVKATVCDISPTRQFARVRLEEENFKGPPIRIIEMKRIQVK